MVTQKNETDLAKFLSYSSNKVDLAAKGQVVETICCKGHPGISMSGTSFSAPQLTRYAANLKNRFSFYLRVI